MDDHNSDFTSSGYCGSDADVICSCIYGGKRLRETREPFLCLTPRKSKGVRRNNSPTALQRAENGYAREYGDTKVRVRRVAVKAFAVSTKVRVTVATVAGCVREIVNLVIGLGQNVPQKC